MNFLGMGTTEILIIALIAFVLLGPQRMIDAAKMAGKATREIRKTIDDLPSLDLDITGDDAPAKDQKPSSQVITPAATPVAAQDADGPIAFQPAKAAQPIAPPADQAQKAN